MLPTTARWQLAVLALLFGCSAGAPVGATRLVGAADAGAAVALSTDELLTVTLEARLSTGYSWQVDEIDGAVLRLAGREQESAPILGGMDREVLRFAGVAAGRTRLGLAYRRPWDPPGSGDETYQLEVEVSGPYTGPYRAPVAAAERIELQPLATTVPSSYNACASPAGPYARCTPIKDQGACGGCWAFATAGVFENTLYQADPSQVPDLSEQYLISCNREGWSCAGGWAAFDYYVDRRLTPPEAQAGAVYEADLPYAAQSLACGSSPHPHHEKATSWGWAVAGSPPAAQRVAAIKQAILDHGPVWTTLCTDGAFSGWNPGTGVFAGSACTDVNHAVVLVGWDDGGGQGSWILRNSWGPRWGDQGYMRIAWGANRIGEDAAYVVYQGTNRAPLASAGATQSVDAGDAVALDGSASQDPDGSIQGYAWTQTSGPPVALGGATSARATFTAPPVSQDAVLGFELTVQDDRGARSSATTTVTVHPADHTSQGLGPTGVTAGCGAAASGLAGFGAALALLLAGRRRRGCRPGSP